MEFTSSSVQSPASSSGSRRSRRSSKSRSRSAWPSSGLMSNGYLAVLVIVVVVTLQFASQVQSASVNKRSVEQSEDVCRNNAICGWEVYHPSTRNLQYYVASSCKCHQKESCIRAEDDISISAWVFRCRDARKRKTTRLPSIEQNDTS
ncbi:unnamed protein product [Orchesella dallaii]|uniref:Uncharacterized protein n=1 Tax=Orchesella dallaii TaxID=48710 RepID=A0ABP1QHM0_9HEXA